MSLWAITTFFNPSGFTSLVNNHTLFASNLKRQGVNLLTVEVAFGSDPFYLEGAVQVRSPDCMWLKERLINHAISTLPEDCDKFAWLDCDLILPDNWAEQTSEKLDECEVAQLFKRVYHLPKGHTSYQGEQNLSCEGIVSQKKRSKNWLDRRVDKDLPFAAPGFAWAARRDALREIYDRDVVGSGDCILVDCMLGSWPLHGYDRKFTPRAKRHIDGWCNDFKKKNINVDYLPFDVFHLWHGNLRNRGYMRRHEITLAYDYDPEKDIKLSGQTFVWASDKPKMHQEIKGYFDTRLEDTP